MSNLKSKLSPVRGGFVLFPKLPVELQVQVWEHAAIDWAIEQVIYMTSPPTPNDKTVFMLHIPLDAVRLRSTCHPNEACRRRHCWRRPEDGDLCYYWRLKLPPMLVLNHLARAVMYDTLLRVCRPKEPVPRGGDACVYIVEYVQGKNDYNTPKYYGLRIQDMRPPGLGKRMKEEEERLAEMQAELTELVELGLKKSFTDLNSWDDHAPVENVVFRRDKPEGWFRLPLNYDVAYYKVDRGKGWVNKHIK